MKAEMFRKGREEVERIIGTIEEQIKTNIVLEPEKKIEQAQQIADGLGEEASGEIQHRSVKNMHLKISLVQGKLKKVQAKKKTVKRIVRKK